jgi:hypothetical protein
VPRHVLLARFHQPSRSSFSLTYPPRPVVLSRMCLNITIFEYLIHSFSIICLSTVPRLALNATWSSPTSIFDFRRPPDRDAFISCPRRLPPHRPSPGCARKVPRCSLGLSIFRLSLASVLAGHQRTSNTHWRCDRRPVALGRRR